MPAPLTPPQLAAAMAAHTQPPVPRNQLTGELHVLRLQQQALGRDIMRREQALATTYQYSTNQPCE